MKSTEFITGTIEIMIGDSDSVVTIDVDAMMRIDDQNLSKEFTQQASLLAYAATLAARAEAEWGYAKLDLEETTASIYKDVRQDAEADGRRTTEAQVDAAVKTSRGYLEASENEIQHKEQYRILRGLVDALIQRGSMLQSLGAHLRSEMDQTDMIIRDAKSKLKGDFGKVPQF
jgi:hypothetical protein